ncbi:hypothetical protein PMI08_03152 [Brevibacillus sp. CF112]|nr:hypothetical protein [Brevibacillus sp. CF112]EJL42501.1 hypothetical protein PMI08_03152 [Brevibacillus sp. CF112]
MERSLFLLMLAIAGAWLIIDDLFGSKRITALVASLNLPRIPYLEKEE